MGTIKRTKEEIVQIIKKVLLDLYDEKYLGIWIESRERPITKILLQNGLQTNYSCALIEVLKSKKVLDTKDSGVAMQYFLHGDYIPDFDVLAEQIYQNYLERVRRRREYDGYRDGSKSDCRPKQFTEKKTIKCGNAVITKREKIELGDMVYLVRNNVIVEGKVVGMTLDEYNKIKYNVKYLIGENWEYCSGEKMFRTVDGVLYYLRNNVAKYNKK